MGVDNYDTCVFPPTQFLAPKVGTSASDIVDPSTLTITCSPQIRTCLSVTMDTVRLIIDVVQCKHSEVCRKEKAFKKMITVKFDNKTSKIYFNFFLNI